MSKRRDITAWWCERCKASGVLRTAHGTSIYDVLILLRQKHDDSDVATLRCCVFDSANVRVELIER